MSDPARPTASAGDRLDLMREGSSPPFVLGMSSADRPNDSEVNIWFVFQRAFVRSQWPDQPSPSQVYSTVAGPTHESSATTPDAENACDHAGLSQAMSSSARPETEGPPAAHAEGTSTYADDLGPASETVSPSAALSFEAHQRFPPARDASDAAVSWETPSVSSLPATDGPRAAPAERPSPSSDDLWHITPAQVKSIIKSETEAFEHYLRAALPSYLHRGPSGSLAASPVLGMSLRDSLIYGVYDLFAYARIARGVCADLFARRTTYSSRLSVYLPGIAITLSEQTGRVHVLGPNTTGRGLSYLPERRLAKAKKTQDDEIII